jgi:hypothetical protein
MTEEQNFNNRKEKLIDSYMEYISKLNSLSLADVSNLEKFREMTISHSKAATESIVFTEYIQTHISRKEK